MTSESPEPAIYGFNLSHYTEFQIAYHEAIRKMTDHIATNIANTLFATLGKDAKAWKPPPPR